MPWMSVTTAMIDVTATMLPSTVMNERSLFAQMALSAIPTASKNLFMLAFRPGGFAPPDPPSPSLAGTLRPAPLRRAPAARLAWTARRPRRRLFDLDRRAVGELTNRAERPDDDAVALGQAAGDLEVLVARDAGLDRREHRFSVLHDEHAFELFPRLAGLELRGLHAPRAPGSLLCRFRVADEVPLLVDDHLPDCRGLNRSPDDVLARRGGDLGRAREPG